MKKTILFVVLIFSLFLFSSPMEAIPLAEIQTEQYYLIYNIQTGVQGIQYLNINGDLGISEYLGMRFGYFYTGVGDDYLDLFIKFKAFDETTFSISGNLGLHGSTRDGFQGTSAGIMFQRDYNENIDILGSLQIPWGGETNLGFGLGLSFHLTPRTSLQVGLRDLALRKDSFGLFLGLMTDL